MNLSKLKLEKIKFPENIKAKMEDDVWECYDFEPFVINVSDILGNGKEMLSYSLEFSPFDEVFKDLSCPKIAIHQTSVYGIKSTNKLCLQI